MSTGLLYSPGANGWPAVKVFDGASNAYCYDDLYLMPGHSLDDPAAVDLSGRFTKKIMLSAPIIAGPDPRTTETEMAIALALVGSIGIIHGHQSRASQVEMVERVKRFTAGFITNPFTLGPMNTVADLDKLRAEKGIKSAPVTEDGKLGGKLIGIVTARDTDAVEDRSERISHVMIKKVALAREPISLQGAIDKIRTTKVGKLPIVNAENELVSFITRSDLKKLREFPSMSRDQNGKLLVGAAILADGDRDWDRAQALIEAGADVLQVDTTTSVNDSQLTLIGNIKRDFPNVEVIAGPVPTCREAKRLMDAGADSIMVGTNPSVEGPATELDAVGRSEATAIFEIARYASLNFGCPVIACDGIRNVGHALKALCLGAASVMVSDLLVGCNEAPTRALTKEEAYAQAASIDKASGAGGPVGRGPVAALPPYLLRALRHGFQDLGIASIPDAHDALHNGALRMEVRSPFALRSAQVRALAEQHCAHPESVPLLVDAGGHVY